MSHEVTRIFHPVGQGAFYSERHDVDGQRFNIVYDCGSLGVKRGTKVVEDAFHDNEIIDILFVSHFDYDHISLIPVLLNKCQIRKVVLPLLHEDIRFVLSGCYRYRMASNGRLRPSVEKSLQLLNDPQSWFRGENGVREKVQFVFVRPDLESDAIDNSERRNQLNREEEEFVNSQGGSLINSRSEKDAKSLCVLADWMFLPYNMDYFSRNRDLVTKLIRWLNQNSYSLQDLNNDQFYRRLFCNNGQRRQFAQIFRSLKGTINENSMLLFSGPSQQHYQCEVSVTCYPFHSSSWCLKPRLPGCLYTGDFNLKQESLRSAYSSYFDRVGTVQVPHHGSEQSFELNNFHAQGMFCPVSYGVSNQFGHPDQVVIDGIVSAGGCPIFVTNDRFSKFEERIRI